MYSARRSLIALLLTGILLTSCGGQLAAGQPTPDVNGTVAAAAGTMAAALFQTQTALAPVATDTALPTPTFLPTSTALALPTLSTPTTFATQAVLFASTATPTGTYYTSTPLSSSLAVGCNNLSLVRDVTIPSGTVMTPGQEFTKTWQVANNGTCDWLYLYSLAFSSGDRMSGNGHRLSMRVPPGEWRQISVDLDAPNNPGTYTGYWRVADGDGRLFGATLSVSIVVKKNPDPTKTPDAVQTAVAGTVIVQMTQSAAVQQTAAAAAQQTAVQNAVNTAVAGTATANCQATQTAGGTCP